MHCSRRDQVAKSRSTGSRVHWVYRVAVDAIRGFIRHNVLTEAAALAFYSALSLAPILLLIIWVAGSLGFDARQDILSEIDQLLGAQAADAVALVIENADGRPDVRRLAGWISLGTLLFSATGVFAQLQQAMNKIWAVEAAPGSSILMWLRKRLLSLGLVVSLGFVLLVSMVVSAGLSAASRWLEAELPAVAMLWPIFDVALPFAIYLAGFMIITRVLPDRQLRWRDVFLSSLFIAALFTAGKFAIGLYLSGYASDSAYGAAGSLLTVLLWTYYSAIIVLFGTELSAAGVANSRRHAPPEAHAEVAGRQSSGTPSTVGTIP